MKGTVPVATGATAKETPLAARVQEALGELVGAAREGLLALSVGVGLGVVHELMEEELVEVVGPKGRHDPERMAVRHGHEEGELTLGGRRVPVRRPRARAADGSGEVELRLSPFRRPRSPGAGRAGADAGRGLHPPLRGHQRADGR